MGYTMDFVGHVLIAPPLNDRRADYLSAFTRSGTGPSRWAVRRADHPLEPCATADIETYRPLAAARRPSAHRLPATTLSGSL